MLRGGELPGHGKGGRAWVGSRRARPGLLGFVFGRGVSRAGRITGWTSGVGGARRALMNGWAIRGETRLRARTHKKHEWQNGSALRTMVGLSRPHSQRFTAVLTASFGRVGHLTHHRAGSPGRPKAGRPTRPHSQRPFSVTSTASRGFVGHLAGLEEGGTAQTGVQTTDQGRPRKAI